MLIRMSPAIVSSVFDGLSFRSTYLLYRALWYVYIFHTGLSSRAPSLQFSSVIISVGLGVSHGDSYRTENAVSSIGTDGPSGPSNSAHNYPASTLDSGIQVSLKQTTHTQVDGILDDFENNVSSAHAKLKSSPLGAV
jgi:hypothetical protein